MRNIHSCGALLTLSLLIQSLPAQAASLNNSIYVPVEPCRVGNSAPAKVTAGSSVEWLAYGSNLSPQGGAASPGCVQPKTGMKPIGVALNVTVVGNQATGSGNVVAYPANVMVAPTSSLVNYKVGTNIANSTIVGLCQDGVCDGKFKLQSNLSDVPVIADVQGYFYPAPGHVANVAVTGGDYTSPVDAMADVANWCGTPSTNNQCQVMIAPGTYTVTETVVMQEWVSIQGSGQKVTKIIGSVGTGALDATSAIVSGANNAALTDLALENTGGSTYSFAIFNNTASPRIERITSSVSGGTSSNFAVYNQTSSPIMTDITATAFGGSFSRGLNNASSSPAITNLTATASGGVIQNIGITLLLSSPTMSDVTVTASGGSSGTIGILINDSNPIMTNVTATASGGSINYGISSVNSSASFIQNSVLEGSTVGLFINSSGTRVVHSKIIGGVNDNSGTTNCRGTYNAALADVTC